MSPGLNSPTLGTISPLIRYLMDFLIVDYSFNFCACTETKHVQILRKLNGGGEVSCFVLLVF